MFGVRRVVSEVHQEKTNPIFTCLLSSTLLVIKNVIINLLHSCVTKNESVKAVLVVSASISTIAGQIEPRK